MRRNLIPILIGAALGLAAAWFVVRAGLPPLAPAPAPVRSSSPIAETAIHDGKTLDFSSGQPHVQDTPADRAALEKAKREMDEATKDVTFAPRKPVSAEAK